MSISSLIDQVKATNQDFEWYPTTDEMIDVVKSDIYGDSDYIRNSPTILDCGAGDGRVLNALTDSSKYAIEKSKPLLNSLDKNIFVVGTDFHQQTLIDKKVDVVFCNPPYSEFSTWMEKIIKEANAKYVYFIVPTRWLENQSIKDVIEQRDAKYEILGNYDFLNAERAARANVHLLKIKLGSYHQHTKIDPFELWFNDNFTLEINNTDTSKYEQFNDTKDKVKKSVKNELVSGNDTVKALEKLYLRDLEHLMTNYKALEQVSPELMKELDVNMDSVRSALQMKIENLKDIYWKEFFDSVDKITNKLTHKMCDHMLNQLNKHTHIDFSVSNAYALTLWAVKNANQYYDDQLIETFERMVEKANIVNYKSNKKTFGNETWRYSIRDAIEKIDRYGLDYRIVLERIGGINTSVYDWERRQFNGLKENAYHFINDLRVIADNLGYSVEGQSNASTFEWTSNSKCEFFCTDLRTGNLITLMEVRAFKNQNLHIKFNQDFMKRLNIEFGRLKGWLKSHGEAADELEVTEEFASECFGTNHQLGKSTLLMLGFDN